MRCMQRTDHKALIFDDLKTLATTKVPFGNNTISALEASGARILDIDDGSYLWFKAAAIVKTLAELPVGLAPVYSAEEMASTAQTVGLPEAYQCRTKLYNADGTITKMKHRGCTIHLSALTAPVREAVELALLGSEFYTAATDDTSSDGAPAAAAALAGAAAIAEAAASAGAVAPAGAATVPATAAEMQKNKRKRLRLALEAQAQRSLGKCGTMPCRHKLKHT